MVAWKKSRSRIGRHEIHVPQFAEGCRRLRETVREVQGCVVLDGEGIEKYVDELLAEGRNRRYIETLLNHRHLRMLLSSFDYDEAERWTHEDLVEIVEVYGAMVERELSKRFPDKRFVVEIEAETDEDGDEDFRVTCFQISDSVAE